MSVLYGIAAATTALLLAAVLAALLRPPALRLGLVDRRRRQRRVPLSGGVAVVVTTCLVAGAGDWSGIAPLGPDIGALVLAAAAVAVLGLIADLWRLRTRLLVLGTAVAAAFVVPYGDTGAWAGAVAVAWITFVALAFRALDHADGVAGTVGVVTAFGVAACAAFEVLDGLAVLLSVLAAALTGFLMHNWPPARVALGGCGSLFAGFLLASAAVTARAGYEEAVGAGVLFALTAVAGADAVLVVVARRLAGRPLLRGGPDHLAHRLRRLGITPQGATVLLGAAAFSAVLVGTLVHSGWAGPYAVWWVAGGALAAVLGLLRVPARKAPRARGGGEAASEAPAHTRAREKETAHTRARKNPRTHPRRAPLFAPRRQSESAVRLPESSDSRHGQRMSPQVSASLRVRNG
ncbi:undecaprenyl/decaprenyl-phosphate alpha-N-acetylglucosaminyl 1-phosphate transferase [Streptomyces antibioticus]|nr:MraY family glycosyltransferase [Streptomyces antibioticus]MCX4737805.1 undecaprenyl/decaprenyl-phosphate alpha-N-acetylglucosaminyl 1-phosphate transferase [Streptomyces antibioticus]MCX5170407.1 undecaprenyl/decaprenyl-phosphate alpha-N-acetylglucosaminyl 1-phosphate transferase [Streptomyces antibioticus]